MGLAIILGLRVLNEMIFWALVWAFSAVNDVPSVRLDDAHRVRGRAHRAPIGISCP